MADWMLYTIIGAVTLLVILLIILVVRGKITIGEIEIGWPPKIKLTPKSDGSLPPGSKDEIVAKNEGEIGNVKIKGAAPSFRAEADNKGKIGDVEVERKM
ncbi:MAG: hypothetical protein J7466_20235 [Roseiflexus sp.]|jgi:hypothetical protein|nr:hypothetical protein [Roseiflexus sp.]